MAFKFTPPCCCCVECSDYRKNLKHWEYQNIPPCDIDTALNLLLQQEGQDCQYGIFSLYDKVTRTYDTPGGAYAEVGDYIYFDPILVTTTYFDSSTGRTATDKNGKPIFRHYAGDPTVEEGIANAQGEVYATWGKCEDPWLWDRYSVPMPLENVPKDAWTFNEENLVYTGLTSYDRYQVWEYTASAEYNNVGVINRQPVNYLTQYILSFGAQSGRKEVYSGPSETYYRGFWDWQQSTPVGFRISYSDEDIYDTIHATANGTFEIHTGNPRDNSLNPPDEWLLQNRVRGSLITFGPIDRYYQFCIPRYL